MFIGHSTSKVSKTLVIAALQEYFEKRVDRDLSDVEVTDVRGIYNDADAFEIETNGEAK